MNRKKQPPPGEHQFEFRIVAGSLKGRIITAPDLGVTRPPLSRLRKSLFDFLNPYLVEARYLDLFSGTGSYLFEAASRGAATVVGVELEPQLCDAINRQALELDVNDVMSCLCEDVMAALPRLSAKQARFDIVTLAPPQYKGIINHTLERLAAYPVFSDGALIVCQHDTSETGKIDVSGWELRQRRKYGNTTFTIVSPSTVE